MSNAQLYLFRAIWGFPYFFRALRLKLIWGIQKSYFVELNEDENGGQDQFNSVLQSLRLSPRKR